MKNFLLISVIFLSTTIVTAQEITKSVLFDSIVQVIEKAHSSLGQEALYTIGGVNKESLTIGLSSKTDPTTAQTIETFELDLNELSDVYAVPNPEGGTTLIVNLKTEVLIQKKVVEFKNMFHEEIVTEDFREIADLWFIFKNENDASNLESCLMKLKKK